MGGGGGGGGGEGGQAKVVFKLLIFMSAVAIFNHSSCSLYKRLS